jgi:hypothetical protein
VIRASGDNNLPALFDALRPHSLLPITLVVLGQSSNERCTELLVHSQRSNISLKRTFDLQGEELRIDDKDALQFLNRGLKVKRELRTPLILPS